MLFSVFVPSLLLVAVCAFVVGFAREAYRCPFLAALAIFVLCFVGLGISFYPYIVPTSLTI